MFIKVLTMIAQKTKIIELCLAIYYLLSSILLNSLT
jgi:hypothetical protein